jgi:hypothetical protein
VAEDRGSDTVEAFARAATVVARSVSRHLGKSGLRTPRRLLQASGGTKQTFAEEQQSPSLIGRTEGRSRENLLAAQQRPEKKSRQKPVDTARPRTSASARKVGHGSSARRNTKLNEAGMSSTLEDSAKGKPSRKSTRRSNNRVKSASNLQRRQTRRTSSSKARATRAAVAR